MPLRGGPPPDYGQLGQLGGVGQQAQPQVPGLLQMAQDAMGGGGRDVRGVGGSQAFGGGSVAPSGNSFAPEWIKNTGGYSLDQLPAWYNPANWGPAPMQNDSKNPNAKFWTGGDAMKQQYA